MILLFAAPPAAFADELPADAQAILDESGVDITDAAGWSLSDLCDTLGSWLAEGFQPALHFAAQAAGYLLLAGLLGLLAGSPYSGYVEILAVLGFGSLSLSTVMQLTELVAATAQDCRTYLTTFVPVFSGLAAAGGQVSGALVYSGMFLAMSGFSRHSSKNCCCPSCRYTSASPSAPACGATTALRMPLRCLPAVSAGY